MDIKRKHAPENEDALSLVNALLEIGRFVGGINKRSAEILGLLIQDSKLYHANQYILVQL